MKHIKRFIIGCIIAMLAAVAVPSYAFASGGSTTTHQITAVTPNTKDDLPDETAVDSAVVEDPDASQAEEEDPHEKAARVRKQMFAPENIKWIILIIAGSFALAWVEQRFTKNRRRF